MRAFLPLVLLLAPGVDDAGDEIVPSPPGLVVSRGEELDYVVPDHEVLDFEVVVDIAILGSTGMGSFQLSAGTEPFKNGLASEQPGENGTKLGWIRGRAMGEYLNYSLDHTIEARILPQDWPRVIYRDTQKGSENRRRELMYGHRDGKPLAWYRSDRHCKKCDRPEHIIEGNWPFSEERHCKKCKRGEHRIWKKPETHDVPEGSVDMLSAIHLARSMVRERCKETTFPLISRDNIWYVSLHRAERREIVTPAGTFRCRAIKLDPVPSEDPEDEDDERFEGLFGIHGTLSIWLHEPTGVPVKIEGLVPAGPFEVDVALNLKAFEGTPDNFLPVE